MISTQIAFSLVERKNVHSTSGHEWALNAQIGLNLWSLKAWEAKPKASEVADIIQIILRAFEFYHSNLRLPDFKMDIVRWPEE